MQFSYQGVIYSFGSAPTWVRHSIRLLTSRWGTDLTNAQPFAIHKALDLGRRFGSTA